MSTDTVTTQPQPIEIGSKPAPLSNSAVISRIKAHHTQLSRELVELTTTTVDAARNHGHSVEDTALGTARARLSQWYAGELIPHAQAEEKTLYDAGHALPAATLLVDGMLAEHRALIALVGVLDKAHDPVTIAATAAALHTLFDVHLAKENDLLLPALDAAGTELATLLDGMHELLGYGEAHAHDAVEADSGCGCGCNCGSDEAADEHAIPDLPVAVTGNTQRSAAPLDVRTLPHGARHEIIFSRLNDLATGESLTILNDHDPKPLRYQTAAMWPDKFVWNYLQSGPVEWRVEIVRAN